MNSLIISSTTSSPSASGIVYNRHMVNDGASWNATETNRNSAVPHAVTIDRLFVYITAPGAGTSRTFTLMKNGSTTGLTVTISDAATSGSDTTHTVTYAAGDTISLQANRTGTPASSTVYWTMRQAATSLFMVSGSDTGGPSSATNYDFLQGYSSTNMTTEGVAQQVIPSAGTLKNLYIQQTAAVGAGNSLTYTVYKNGSATTLSVAVSNPATTGNDTTHTVSVVAGDTVSMEVAIGGSPTSVGLSWGLSFAPTTDGESFLMFGDAAGGPSTSATNYQAALGEGGLSWNSNEGNRILKMASTTLEAFYMKVDTAPSTGKKWTFTVRQKPNGGSSGDTTATFDIADTATTGNITGKSISFGDGDEIAIKAVPTSTPTASPARGGILLFIASAGDLSVNVSESSTVTENLVEMVESYINKSESSTVTEYLDIIRNNARDINVSDTSAITENLIMLETAFINKSESSSITENVVLQIVSFINVSDSSTVTDSTNIAEADQINVNDSSAITENLVMIGTSFINVSDSTTITEAQTLLELSFINKSNTSIVTENISVLLDQIRFDAASSSGYQASLSSYSWNHTTSGTNRGLIVAISIFASGTVSTLKYASIDMTFVTSNSNGLYRIEMWSLEAPTIGTNAIDVTLSTSLTSIGSAVSYTGTNQTDLVEVFNSTNGLSGTPSVTLTTLTDYDWVVDGIATSNTSINPAAGQTSRADNSGLLGTGGMSDKSNIEPPASVTMSWDAVGITDKWALASLALVPSFEIPIPNINVSDNSTISENIIFQVNNFINTNDSSSITENNILMLQSHVNVSESSQITESVNIAEADQISTSDSSGITDNSQVDIPESITINEASTITESIVILIPFLLISLNDNTAVIDSLNKLLICFINISDSSAVTDSINIAIGIQTDIPTNVNDSSSITESLSLQQISFINISETSSITETLNLLAIDIINVSDSSSVTENINITIPFLTINTSENIQITDSVVMFKSILDYSVSDSISITEFIAFNINPWEIDKSTPFKTDNNTSWEVDNPRPFKSDNNSGWYIDNPKNWEN